MSNSMAFWAHTSLSELIQCSQRFPRKGWKERKGDGGECNPIGYPPSLRELQGTGTARYIHFH